MGTLFMIKKNLLLKSLQMKHLKKINEKIKVFKKIQMYTGLLS